MEFFHVGSLPNQKTYNKLFSFIYYYYSGKDFVIYDELERKTRVFSKHVIAAFAIF